MIKFSLDGAEEAKMIIEECFYFAVERWRHNIEEKNLQRKKYWISRVGHFIGELNWIDTEIIKKAGDNRLKS